MNRPSEEMAMAAGVPLSTTGVGPTLSVCGVMVTSEFAGRLGGVPVESPAMSFCE
jgi:hypothetical protein